MTDGTKEVSDFSMSRKECPKCGAVWLNGVHVWQTGQKGNDLDLAGLVCNQLSEEDAPLCINIMRGQIGGQPWEKRAEQIDLLMEEMRKKQDWDS